MVDDEVDILHVVKRILTRNNFTVVTISQWQIVFETVQTFTPDLILLDVNLNGADGREICTQLKSSKETENIPVILFSDNYNSIHNLRDCKPDAIIAKPFDSSGLVSTILNNLK